MNLPIEKILPLVEELLESHQMVIISTPTGTGKTMMIPFSAFENSGKQVYCTVPRRILATEAMKSANEIHGHKKSGFIHGEAEGNIRSEVVYITEGSFAMRRIADKLKHGAIICLDEVHEQGKLLEALLFSAIDYCRKGLKVVLMSATLEIPKYKGYFEKRGISVGVAELPPKETNFPIEYIIADNPEKAVARAANDGGRVIVGLAGVKEIEEFQTEIERTFKGKIFQIHGEVEIEDQEAALDYNGSCVYICTNMVQSGITIKNLTHGYFEGYGKRMELTKGEEKLTKYLLSKSEIQQWFGRLGRMCKGTIFVTSEKQRDLVGRDEMPIPEILRTSLEDIILQFAFMGYRFQDCKLLNKPSKENIDISFKKLYKLGCVDENNDVTEFGLKVIAEGYGVRGGIVVNKGRDLGFENLAKKIAVVSGYRSYMNKGGGISTPLQKIKRWLKDSFESVRHSDLLILVKVAEYFIGKYCISNETDTGYIIDPMQMELFKQECDDAFIFRRTLQNIMFQFHKIDKKSEDTSNEILRISDAIQAMYADNICDAMYGAVYDGKIYREISKGTKAYQGDYQKVVGEFAAIESSKKKTFYIIENVTYF